MHSEQKFEIRSDFQNLNKLWTRHLLYWAKKYWLHTSSRIPYSYWANVHHGLSLPPQTGTKNVLFSYPIDLGLFERLKARACSRYRPQSEIIAPYALVGWCRPNSSRCWLKSLAISISSGWWLKLLISWLSFDLFPYLNYVVKFISPTNLNWYVWDLF